MYVHVNVHVCMCAGMYACRFVCTSVHAGICAHGHIHMDMLVPEVNIRCLSSTLSSFASQGLSLNLEHAGSAWQASETFLPLPLQHRDCKGAPPHLTFTWVLWTQIQVLAFMRQALYKLSCFPGPLDNSSLHSM